MIYADKKAASERIAKIFEQMGWTWGGGGTPTEEQIYEAFSNKQEDFLTNEDLNATRSGRLFVEKVSDSGQIVYGLEQKSCEEWMEWCEFNLPH